MEAVFLDIHIHTSIDPNNLNENYDIDLLANRIKKFTKDSEFLISLSDHNAVNKAVYLKASEKIKNILVGAELHVRNYPDCPPYHCHILFNLERITEEAIDDINERLDALYPNKVVSKTDTSIPDLERIIKEFDAYEIILLPHGGQSHSTFHKSIPEGVKFDNTIERSIYYNQFDGFTARGNTGLEKTQEYFKRLGINEFVNLLTCTDNYSPENYPNAKRAQSKPFVPTWMMAMPTFNGLRLSLSESSRLVYSSEKPTSWSEYIKSVQLKNDQIDIDVQLTSGLNVVIGGSSSGKTLFVDSICKKISEDFNGSEYLSFEVNKLKINNPSGIKPHYLSQNYIMSVVNDYTEDQLNHIGIIKSVFPGDDQIKKNVKAGLAKLKDDIGELIKCAK